MKSTEQFQLEALVREARYFANYLRKHETDDSSYGPSQTFGEGEEQERFERFEAEVVAAENFLYQQERFTDER